MQQDHDRAVGRTFVDVADVQVAGVDMPDRCERARLRLRLRRGRGRFRVDQARHGELCRGQDAQGDEAQTDGLAIVVHGVLLRIKLIITVMVMTLTVAPHDGLFKQSNHYRDKYFWYRWPWRFKIIPGGYCPGIY